MDYENFKERFVEDLKDKLYEKGKIFELGEKFVERQAERDDQDIDKEEKGSVLGELKAKKEEVSKTPKKDAVDKASKTKGGEAI